VVETVLMDYSGFVLSVLVNLNYLPLRTVMISWV
jgi:hypothetical protein